VPDHTKKVTPAIFALAALSFLLPFVVVSCGSQAVTLTGLDLATGTTVQQPGGQRVSAEPTATLALVAAGLGCALGFVGVPALVRTVMGGFGALMLVLLKNSLDQQARGTVATVNYAFGYWFALLLLAGGAVFNGYLAVQKETSGSKAASLATTPHLAGPPGPTPATLCHHCGAPTAETAKFCAGCGKPLLAGADAGQSHP